MKIKCSKNESFIGFLKKGQEEMIENICEVENQIDYTIKEQSKNQQLTGKEFILFALLSQYCTEILGFGFKSKHLKKFQIENNLDTAQVCDHVLNQSRLFLEKFVVEVNLRFDDNCRNQKTQNKVVENSHTQKRATLIIESAKTELKKEQQVKEDYQLRD